MKLIIIAAVLAVASARPEYHDDVFHFSTLDGLKSLRTQSVQTVSQPAVIQKVLQAPTVTKQYTVQKISQQPVYTQFVSQPAIAQQYTVQKIQPVHTQFETHHIAHAQPVHAQIETHHFAQPVHTQVETHHFAQPAITTFQQPAITTTYHAQQPAVTTYQHQQSAAVTPYSSVNVNQPLFRILKRTQEFDPLGYYRYSYETENGIKAEEQGSVNQQGSKDESIAKEGYFTYTGPDNVVYTITYTADENGFVATGDHIPTPPPIPAEIQRSLEINAAEPKSDDSE